GGGSGNAGVDFATELVLMKGHLRAANELTDLGEFEKAAPHMGHPAEESYDPILPFLEANNIPGFLDKLVGLNDAFLAFQAAPTDSAAEAAYEAAFADAIAAIDGAFNALDESLRTSADFVLPLIDQVLAVTDFEYNNAIADGVFVEEVEYQDSYGFIREAEMLYETVKDQINADAQATIEGTFDDLEAILPTVTLPDAPIEPASVLTELVVTIDDAVDYSGELLGELGVDLSGLVFAGKGNDTVFGSNRDDLLSGDSGDDTIEGRDGNDLIMGVTGDDILSGGSGRDVFVYGNGDGTDVITDFEVGTDLFGLVEGELVFEDLTFTQSGSDALLGVASSGEVLSILTGVDASALDEASFVSLPDISNPDDVSTLL
ncbi:MAG: hypothetical protein AAFX40_04675, partial [Cyanobacteria bacterium J06639_1]